ncbi:hypothetical protein ACFWIB_14410 [Streptomyces sp. NPDC127051]|uniref:hypothetical protein n=1 Tax=Streptomyces sp. NPDC127051 TaxID=3347119 RepID=UPI003665807E
MTTVLERSALDLIEDALVEIDAEFAAIFGLNPTVWSEDARRLYFEVLAEARMGRPYSQRLRRSSSASRRHHRRYLAYRVDQLVPGAVSILLTWASSGQPLAVVRDATGDQIRLPRGASRVLAARLQAAFTADWSVPQTWRADTNSLTAWGSR